MLTTANAFISPAVRYVHVLDICNNSTQVKGHVVFLFQIGGSDDLINVLIMYWERELSCPYKLNSRDVFTYCSFNIASKQWKHRTW